MHDIVSIVVLVVEWNWQERDIAIPLAGQTSNEWEYQSHGAANSTMEDSVFAIKGRGGSSWACWRRHGGKTGR